MKIVVRIEALEALVAQALAAAGASDANARIVARVVAAAERDGCHSHGILRLPGFVTALRSGWLDGRATPRLRETAPGAISVDAGNGFAQVALDAGRGRLMEMARKSGIAAMAVHNGHHFAALWPDVEPFAEAGFIAISCVSSRKRIAPWSAKRKLFGTNPMAFACPRAGRAPFVWDQASSVMSQGEMLICQREGRPLPEGVGIDADGRPTTSPEAILGPGAFLPFGAHKGSAIAAMVEILAAAVGGAEFGFEDRSAGNPGATTSRSGQFLLLIDPSPFAGPGFAKRLELLFSELADAGVDRLPGDRRHEARRKAVSDGIAVERSDYDRLVAFAGPSAGSKP
ncbi:MAG: Ldh family oxidoreductase [Alphaproteobacteria bacterium]|nr:Ldh family oxidoreductase [Alphaproteobacteria bacterium]